MPISQNTDNIQILTDNMINKLKLKYNYIYFGLIQVAIKPLTRLGLNMHSLTYVTDDRHANFNDSLIEIVEASLQDGPAFFNCFSNFSVSLTDKNIKQLLCLGIQTLGFDMPNSEHIALVYRIYYKAMNSIIPNIAYAKQIHRATTLFLTNFSNKVITP